MTEIQNERPTDQKYFSLLALFFSILCLQSVQQLVSEFWAVMTEKCAKS